MERIEMISQHLKFKENPLIKSYYLCNDNTLVISEYRNGCRVIMLNRTNALNSLVHDMILELKRLLLEYRDDRDVKLVMITSNSEKAFCAGGDLKNFSKLSLENPQGLNQFIRSEYSLDHIIHTYQKPIISVVDGIVMGGGVGLSLHCNYRIVTERSLWAMPENMIGYFPDVGSTHFLSRLKHIGLYLALTGARLKYQDSMLVNIGTHFIPSGQNLHSLLNQLQTSDFINSFDEIDQILNTHCQSKTEIESNQSDILQHGDLISTCFNWDHKSFVDIYSSLQRYAQETVNDLPTHQWISKLITILDQSCPTSLMVCFENLHKAIHLPMELAIIDEIRVGSRIGIREDMRIGIDRVLNKSQQVQKPYNPKHFTEVSNEFVQSFFDPLPIKGNELIYDPIKRYMVSADSI
ncbi:enoyl-CoA hydratase/isomerase domain-containing protein [Tieghemostelium lacteum]|uniref:Enoyl-CoA hydratase/isomerase domain-containing protein n=1 Tax=Tieghemostelium lacteum TaxID=361077 RepID=A0A151ZDS6_TIELA|nr:enoyl-CoA hydratase/isomerase domain-containing protein [Tieghemostelium lacteum]|eukprot:KYQ92069.1 enoyl-CoA hydratase/isomerase domain-containing protein [Tieghemostelium lacteum]